MVGDDRFVGSYLDQVALQRWHSPNLYSVLEEQYEYVYELHLYSKRVFENRYILGHFGEENASQIPELEKPHQSLYIGDSWRCSCDFLWRT